MERGIEADAGGQGAAAVAGAAEQVGLGAFAQARLGELLDGILLAVLVDGEVDGAKGAAANLLLDQVLVDAVLGGAVILAVAVLGAGIEGFLAGLAGADGGGGRAAPLRVGCSRRRGGGVGAGSGTRALTWPSCVSTSAGQRHWRRSGRRAAHMYLTGAGRASSGAAGTSSVGRDV